MINRIFTGIDFFDKDVAGLFQYGTYLFCGEAEVGKTVLTSRFLVEGLKKEEMCLFITAKNASVYLNDIQNSLGFDFSIYLQKGLFNILLYEKPEEEVFANVQQYIGELSLFVHKLGVERLVIDFSTVMELLDESKLEEEVREFAKALENLHVSTLLVLETPRSPAMYQAEQQLIKETIGAFKLTKMSSEENKKFYHMETVKISGRFPPLPVWDFAIYKREGPVLLKIDKLSYTDIKVN
ncbi:MAG: RAD55 family ATPase [Candidatus Firestonebacteria bacterium]